ncbi:MAG: LysM domain-containing protein, partial [Candidatus Pacearchaeota archaeon]
PVMTGEQKAYFDERYIEWQSMEALERSVTNANETKQLSGVYEVKKGDTLWAISKATGISIKELLKLNKQLVGRENYIRPGEVINLSVDNMDMDEFNRAATQKEIEMSRRIGEEWERRTYNRESYNDLLEKGIVIASPMYNLYKLAQNAYDISLTHRILNKDKDVKIGDNSLPMLTISKNFFWGDHFSTLDEFYDAKQDEMKRLLIGTGVGILASYGIVAAAAALYYGGAYALTHIGGRVGLSTLKTAAIEVIKNGWKPAILNSTVRTQFKIMENIQQGKNWYEEVPETAGSSALVGMVGGGIGGWLRINETIIGAFGWNAFIGGIQYSSDTLIFGLGEFNVYELKDRAIFGGMVGGPTAYIAGQMWGTFSSGTLKREYAEVTLRTLREYLNKNSYDTYKYLKSYPEK